MFRSKMLLILQNTINKSLYNSGYSICVPFSLNISNTSLIGSSAYTLNKNVNNTSVNTLDQTVSATSTEMSIESLSEVSSTTSTETSTEPLRPSTISVNNLSGTLSTNTSFTEKSNPDKLYKKLEIEVRGNDPAVLRSYITFSSLAAKYLEITVGKIAPPGKPIHQRLTVLKSVHVHKKHRVQYETRTYYRYLELFNLTGSTADTYLEYIQRNLPEGVAMKVTKVELQTLPDTVRQACFSE